MTVTSSVATWISPFSFDAPVASFSIAYNTAASGLSVLTLHGVDFGTATNLTPTANLGLTACFSVTWTTDSSVACRSPPAAGTAIDVTVRVVGVVGTLQAYFTYDSPIISQLMAPNAPTVPTGDVTSSAITVVGTNFGAANLGPSARLSSSACDTTAWITTSYIKCLTPKGVGSTQSMAVTVASLVGTSPSTFAYFTYNSPLICGLAPANAGTTGGSSITLTGLQFGPNDNTVTAQLGSTSCDTASWTSDSSILCTTALAGGVGGRNTATLTVAALVGTTTQAFTYNAPVTSSVSIPNSPTSGAAVITLLGMDFGVPAVTATALAGGTLCSTTSWTTITAVACVSPVGIGRAHPVRLTVASQVGSLLRVLSFDSPVVSFTSSNIAVSGGSVTIAGLEFGFVDHTTSAILGPSSCGTTRWTSLTQVICQVPLSPGSSSNTLAVTVQGVVGTLSAWLTFDAPVITAVRPKS